MKNENKCPERVRKAVLAFARAVSLVADMADLHGADPQTEFHVVEYLPDLETLLIHQLLTALPFSPERRKVLDRYGLEYLTEDMELTEREWERWE